MSRVFSVTNQKGGVGKTTTGINLAHSLAKYGKKVLLIDLDPQGNASAGSGIDRDRQQATVYEVLLKTASVDQAILITRSGYDIIASNRDLSGALIELVNQEHREFRLREALHAVRDQYDYVLIDCPPSLDLLTLNALSASDAVIIPMQCEYFALEGLTELVGTIRKVRETLNPSLSIEGLLRTLYDARNTLAREVSMQLQNHFGDKVYSTIIPRNVRLAEAPSYGKPALEYDNQSKGAQAYLALAIEVLERENRT